MILETFVDLPNVKAVLIANLPGQESGNALVDILFGDVNPSGRLPYTMGKRELDYGPGSKIKYLPSPAEGLSPQQNFSEGLYIDYRHFDKENISPRYEFGYGLSYTQFNLSALSIVSLGEPSALPLPRPPAIEPPSYLHELPDPSSVLFPKNLRRVQKYIYPYLEHATNIHRSAKAEKHLPQSTPSDAGGAQGGNPDPLRHARQCVSHGNERWCKGWLLRGTAVPLLSTELHGPSDQRSCRLPSQGPARLR